MKTFKNPNKHQFESKEQYTAFRKHWAENYKKADRNAHFLYLLILGKDIGSAFTPIKNPKKIPSKGLHEYWALEETFISLKLIFEKDSQWMKKRRDDLVQQLGGFLSAEEIKELLSKTPNPLEWPEK